MSYLAPNYTPGSIGQMAPQATDPQSQMLAEALMAMGQKPQTPNASVSPASAANFFSALQKLGQQNPAPGWGQQINPSALPSGMSYDQYQSDLDSAP